MAYLGNVPAQSFISFERQVFTIVNSQTAYTLSHSVTNENDIRLVVNNVVQEPGSGKAYTASGTTLTLSAALVNGTDEMYCVFLGRAIGTVNAPAGSVGTSQLVDLNVTTGKIAADAINGDKIADDAISDEHLDPTIITGQTAETSIATDDLILLSDTSASGALKKMTRANFVSGVGGNNTPNFWIYKSANQSVATNTAAKIAFDSAVIDTGSGLGSNKWTVPSGGAGTYFLTFKYIWSGTWGARIIAYMYKNGSSIFGMQADKERVDGGVHVNGIVTLSEGDYIEGEVYQDSGSTRDVIGGSLWNSLSGFKLL
jgi:hypothetical protein